MGPTVVRSGPHAFDVPSNMAMEPTHRARAPHVPALGGIVTSRGRDESSRVANRGVSRGCMRSCFFMALVVLSSPTVAEANQGARSEQDETVLMQLQQVLARAWVTGDRATIERFIAPHPGTSAPAGASPGAEQIGV